MAQVMAGRFNRRLNSYQFEGAESDENDEDGDSLLDALASALGAEPRRFRAAMLATVELQNSLSTDGAVIKFEVSTAPGVDIGGSVLLAAPTSVIVLPQTITAGFFVDEVQVTLDGVGSNDIASGFLDITGHQAIPERFIIPSDGLIIKWGRPLSSSHKFTFTCPQAVAGKEILAMIAARGVVPEKSAVRAQAKVVRANAGDDEKHALRNHRNRTKAHGLTGARGLLGGMAAAAPVAQAIGGPSSMRTGVLKTTSGGFKIGGGR